MGQQANGGVSASIPSMANAGFRQLARGLHPDKLSGSDSRVEGLSSKIMAWLNTEKELCTQQ